MFSLIYFFFALSFTKELSEQMKALSFSKSQFKSKLEAKQLLDKYCFAFITSQSMWYRTKVLDWILVNVFKEFKATDILTEIFINRTTTIWL